MTVFGFPLYFTPVNLQMVGKFREGNTNSGFFGAKLVKFHFNNMYFSHFLFIYNLIKSKRVLMEILTNLITQLLNVQENTLHHNLVAAQKGDLLKVGDYVHSDCVHS